MRSKVQLTILENNYICTLYFVKIIIYQEPFKSDVLKMSNYKYVRQMVKIVFQNWAFKLLHLHCNLCSKYFFGLFYNKTHF